MMIRQVFFIGLWSTALLTGSAAGQLRIVNYNVHGDNGVLGAGFDTIFTAIGQDNTAGFARPIDVLMIQETNNQAGATQSIVNILNGIYGAGVYSRGTFNAATSGGGRMGIVYRTASVDLISEIAVGTLDSNNGMARQQVQHVLRPDGYGVGSEFYIYNGHYKAQSTSTPDQDRNRRGVEAHFVRESADLLGSSAKIIYSGDFNSYTSAEVMFVGGATLTGGGTANGLQSPGPGQAHDPINRMGAWSDNAAFKDVFTQAPANSSAEPPSGFTVGGLDDRFDFQLVSGAMLNSEGIAYIPGSYHTFMVNGSVNVNGSINDASNSALPSLPNRTNVLNALVTASDHLPVIVDYQIPARLSVSVTAPPSQVIVGATAAATISVSNTAPVAVVVGADELDYTYSGSGRLSGSGNGIDQALGGANSHTLSLNTATAGLATGTINVTSSSESAASANFSQTVNVSVLSHANPTLSSSSDVNSATIDFGIAANGAGSLSQGFVVANRVQTASYTAGLKLTGINGSGDTAALSTNAATFNNLAAGSAVNFNAFFSKSAGYGTFSASYTLATADQDLPGSTALENLALTLTGILALPGDANIDGFVDTSDFNAVAGNFGQSGGWLSGDFDGSGTIDSTDFTLLTSTFGQRVTMSASMMGAVVPEPGVVSLLPAAFLLLRRRSS